MHRLQELQVCDACLPQPGEKVGHRPNVGLSGVAVGDVGGEELDEPAVSHLPRRHHGSRDYWLGSGNDEIVWHGSSIPKSCQKCNNIKDVMLLETGGGK